ncbi:TlpA disulfide reductase family protein [Xanthomonadaceae bacterium JHOS43]|nr:TlpA disulfide reductase family protein [Xanthomonadaceae bacterium JHOS43]MCX7563109.1 TlpA disulfide reductase family protein [Xanthomonadaceae bacterium XH05]
MKPWKQTVLIGALGIVGAMAGLGAAMLALGPGAVLGTPAGQWVLRHVFGHQATTPDGRAVIGLGEVVPALSLNGLNGRPHTLESHGQPLLINYWASWCPPCVEEMPLLDDFASAQGPGGVRVAGIALDGEDAVKDFLMRHPVAFPIYLETTGPNDSSVLLGNARGVLPYSVLIGADGRLRKTRLGAFREGELEGWVAD